MDFIYFMFLVGLYLAVATFVFSVGMTLIFGAIVLVFGGVSVVVGWIWEKL